MAFWKKQKVNIAINIIPNSTHCVHLHKLIFHNLPLTPPDPPLSPPGSRIKETHDFGFVTLDLMSVVPEDAGVYMCRAVNLAGEAVTSASIHVHGQWRWRCGDVERGGLWRGVDGGVEWRVE